MASYDVTVEMTVMVSSDEDGFDEEAAYKQAVSELRWRAYVLDYELVAISPTDPDLIN